MDIRKHLTRILNFLPKSIFVMIILFSILLIISDLSLVSEKNIRVIKTEQGYQFYDADKPVLFYQVTPKASAKGTYSRANYCHPVYDLDGNIITEDFPKDHLHHRGIFWAWHQVNIGDTRIHDMWKCNDFSWDVHKVQILDNQKGSAAIRANVYWKSPQWKNGNEAFAEEEVTIQVHEVKNNYRAIDFVIKILALEEGLEIGGSENSKEYGGFSPRIVLPEDIAMNDSSGIIEPQRNIITAGNWVNFSGTFGTKKSSFAIFSHPSNPGLSNRWVLRRSRSMQNAAFPGRESVSVSTKKPIILKYRLIFHTNSDLNKLFKKYCGVM